MPLMQVCTVSDHLGLAPNRATDEGADEEGTKEEGANLVDLPVETGITEPAVLLTREITESSPKSGVYTYTGNN